MALDRRIVLLTTLLAGSAALIMVLAPPLAYFYSGYRYSVGHIEAEAAMQGRMLTQIISRDPEFWWYTAEDLADALNETHPHSPGNSDVRRVFNNDGHVILKLSDQPGTALLSPVLVRSHDLHANGSVAGQLVIERSLRPLVEHSLLVFAASLTIGGALFIAMRSLPLRALQRAWERNAFLSNHDTVTGLPNRSLFNELVERSLADARRRAEAVAILFLDLDHFKDVNDTFGHAAGDRLLQLVAERLRACTRQSDALARLGGDEFAILQTGAPQPESSGTLAGRVIDAITQPFELGGNEVAVGVSIGISFSQAAAQTAQIMLRDADLALYRAKGRGRGTFCFFEEEMNTRLEVRKKLERELRRAIAQDELQLVYQPQFDMESGVIVGVEALVRWPHREHGLVMPSEFVPLAEETGLIFPMSAWVLSHACRQCLEWPGLFIAVNLSPVQFRQPGLDTQVERVLRETGLEPHRLELEITERVMLTDTEQTLNTLRKIKALGVSIAMDDFGTGYSSLSYLRRFPFDKIKIDRMFVKDIPDGGDAEAIVRAVVRLAHALGMTATAEGVETTVQADALRAEGCDSVQGFHFAFPAPAAEINALLASPPMGRPIRYPLLVRSAPA